MRKSSQEYDEEAARREPLLAEHQQGAGGSGDGASSRGLSPERLAELHSAATPGGSIRLTKRLSTTVQHELEGEGDQQGGLVLTHAGDEGKDHVRELEVEVVAGAVAEAVVEAVQEAVQEAVHDAVQQAIEENVQFDVRANVYTLVAVTGVILFWRGVWDMWDMLFGADSIWSNMGSLVVGLLIMLLVRFFDLPLVQGLPGG